MVSLQGMGYLTQQLSPWAPICLKQATSVYGSSVIKNSTKFFSMSYPETLPSSLNTESNATGKIKSEALLAQPSLRNERSVSCSVSVCWFSLARMPCLMFLKKT